MRKNETKKFHTDVMAALDPLLMCGNDLIEVKIHLDSMFTKAMEFADDDELENFSARELSPTFKALSESLLYLYQIPQIREMQSNDFSNLLD